MKTYRRPWSWLSPSQREARNESIREQFALGATRQDLAEEYDLTVPRIMQIVTFYRKNG